MPYRVTEVSRNLDVDESGDLMQDAGGTNLTVPLTVVGVEVSNAATAARYLKIYDKATAPLSTDTPIWGPIYLASSSHQMFGVPQGAITLNSGLGVRATTGVADNDTGAPAANDVVVHIFYRRL